MIHWAWLIPVFIVGAAFGIFLMALMVCAGQADDQAERMRNVIPMRKGTRGHEPD